MSRIITAVAGGTGSRNIKRFKRYPLAHSSVEFFLPRLRCVWAARNIAFNKYLVYVANAFGASGMIKALPNAPNNTVLTKWFTYIELTNRNITADLGNARQVKIIP